MRGSPIKTALAALLVATFVTAQPALAQPASAQPDAPMLPSPETQVREAADAFFRALRDEDKTRLADHMLPEGVIFVHNRTNPDLPRVDMVPVADHLARWESQTRSADEVMRYDVVLVDGDMAQVWGPYTFWSEGVITHCGVNSLSMVLTDDGWKVSNTSFTMVAPSECAAINAPAVPEDKQ